MHFQVCITSMDGQGVTKIMFITIFFSLTLMLLFLDSSSWFITLYSSCHPVSKPRCLLPLFLLICLRHLFPSSRVSVKYDPYLPLVTPSSIHYFSTLERNSWAFLSSTVPGTISLSCHLTPTGT